MIQKHPNSRIVTIYRKSSFILDAQKGTASDFVSMAKKSIGSFWENNYSKTQGSGLNFSEQKLLMSTIVDCEPEDRNFRSKVSEYFASIKTVVPYEKGRSLEIGLEKDNNAALSEDNMPLNLADYITYRHALAHPQVAKTKEEGDGNMLKEFYIFDEQADEDRQVKESADNDKALELYLKVKKTPEKIDMLLTLLMHDPRTFKGKNADSLKLNKLKEISTKEPSRFVQTFEGKFFEDLYIIQTMINTGVLQKVGERIIDAETGETIGHDTKEAIAWIKDKGNSDKLVILKARMQEGLSKPVPATVKAK